MSAYSDYRFRFPAARVVQAVAALDALRASGFLGAGGMLGDPMDATGSVTIPDDAIFHGRRAGGHIYLHVRSLVSPDRLTDDLSFFEAVSAKDASVVLGVWA